MTNLSFIFGCSRFLWLTAATLLMVGSITAARATSISPNVTKPLNKCIVGAAQYHGVNPYLLRAILVVESRLNPKAINVNMNGTRDIGVAQINSIHLPVLQNHGIKESHLMDGCVNTYVGAWLLRKQISRHGLNWFGIAAYHSVTPDKNYRYQVLVYNEMVRSGAIQNIAMTVPPLTR
ncbi:MAG: lytic transglycosylase, catalytic [Betaproteobacteria bacterium]|nr:lytic transglycosylase, catalytic [Betaproteobacteria bacterium]